MYLASCSVDPKDILSDSSESDGSDFSDDTEVSLESLDSDIDREVSNSEFKEVQKKGDWTEEHYPPATNSERDARPDDSWTVQALDVNDADNREIPFESLVGESNSKVAQKEFEKTDKSDDWNECQDTPERDSWRHAKPDGNLKDTLVIDVNSVVVLDELREVSWNWFAFVTLLEEQFKNQGYTSEVFDQFLMDFARQLPELGLDEEEQRLTEHSRLSYLEHLRQKEADVGRISDTPSNSSDDEYNEEVIPETQSEKIRLKLKQIDQKSRKKAKKEIEAQRLLRKVSQSAKTIINTYPDIGEVIESFVQESDVGADSWRRTGCIHFLAIRRKRKE